MEARDGSLAESAHEAITQVRALTLEVMPYTPARLIDGVYASNEEVWTTMVRSL